MNGGMLNKNLSPQGLFMQKKLAILATSFICSDLYQFSGLKNYGTTTFEGFTAIKISKLIDRT
jgi:hypothetical protein